MRGDVPIVLEEGSDDDAFRTSVALRDAVAAKSGVWLPIETHARLDDLGRRIELRHSDSGSAAGPEAYGLQVASDRVQLSGGGAAGLRYAAETLAQLLVPGRSTLPCCEIEDSPDLEMRGVLVDVSRGKVPKLETLERIVDFMVRVKLNLLMLYTEHVFRFRRHPLIGRDDSPMSAWELRHLDEYASERHVELVPTLQSLGHMHQILKHARYAGLAESERKWSLSPAVEGSYELLADLYSEYLGNFRSSWFNANCDEPVDLGKGRSKPWAEKEGLGAVFAAHLARVRALAAEHGKRTMVWADVVHEHPDAIPRLARDLVLIDWWYEAKHDFDRVRAFGDHGIAFLAAAGTSSWNTLFPRVTNALANIRGYARAAKRHGAMGLITTDWGDNGHYNLWGNSLYPLAFGAQAAWGSTDLDGTAFDRAFSQQLFDDSSGFAGRFHRRLGALHETGFDHFNNSPLKSLYFDDLESPRFTDKVKPSVLKATLAKLLSAKADLEGGLSKLDARPEDREELRFSVDASVVAARKGLAGARFLSLSAGAERPRRGRHQALAAELVRLASEQAGLKRRHLALWLARNRRSRFETTASYYDVSIRGLRRAARRLGS